VAIATTINPSSAGERELEIYYKVNDPRHFFICKADDLGRRPGQNDGQYLAYKQKMAKMWTDRYIKTHPEHGKGRIDRLSTHRKRKPRRVKVASKSKGKRYTASERRRILRMAVKRGIGKAAEHYGVSSTTIHNWKASGVKTKSNGRLKISTNRGSLSVIRDLAQKLLIAIDEHRAGVDGLYS
jgi:transposase-like protein